MRRCFASVPCAARPAGRSRNSPRCARLKQPSASSLPSSAARRYAQGDPNTEEDRLAYASQARSLRDLGRTKPEASPTGTQPPIQPLLGSRSNGICRVAAPVLGPVWSDEKRRAEGCPAHCAGADSCLRIAKAIRVLAASLRTEHRSEPARFAPARNPGVFFLCLLSFGQAKESESHSSAKQKVRRTRERTKHSRPKTADF